MVVALVMAIIISICVPELAPQRALLGRTKR